MRYKPLKIIIIYILFTVFISFFGPMKYINYDKGSVFLYICGILLCLSVGSLFADKKFKSVDFEARYSDVEKQWDKTIEKFLKIAIVMFFIAGFLEFTDILIKAPYLFSIKNIGRNYLAVREGETSGYSIAVIFRFFTGVFRIVSITLGIYYWKKLTRALRLMLLLAITFLILTNVVAYGTQKFLGDIIIYSSIVAFIKMLDIEKKKRRKIYKYLFLLISIAVIIFSFMLWKRYELISVNAYNFQFKSWGYSYFDTDHIIFKIFGQKIGFGLAMLLSGYLSIGYHGLSLCFDIPFDWSYGIGNSYVLSKFFNEVLGTDNIYNRTYLAKLTQYYGISGTSTWHTIFPWLASDFTFPGTLILFIFIGYIWHYTWCEILAYKNPFSIVIFSTITLGMIFIPANNQLFHGIDTFISTVFVIVFWLAFHKKYNKRKLASQKVKSK